MAPASLSSLALTMIMNRIPLPPSVGPPNLRGLASHLLRPGESLGGLLPRRSEDGHRHRDRCEHEPGPDEERQMVSAGQRGSGGAAAANQVSAARGGERRQDRQAERP